MLAEIQAATGVAVKLDYIGTLDGVERVVQRRRGQGRRRDLVLVEPVPGTARRRRRQDLHGDQGDVVAGGARRAAGAGVRARLGQPPTDLEGDRRGGRGQAGSPTG